MAWNEPGEHDKDKKPDPWGANKNKQNPPDLDQLIAQLLKKLLHFFNFGSKKPTNPSGPLRFQPSHPKEFSVIASVALGVLALIWFVSGFFIVNPAEESVVLRFGQYNETLRPGLHWMARFIDSKYTVDIQKIYSFSLQNDFLTKSSEQGDLPNQLVKAANALDSSDKSKNVVNVELTVQYRVSNPRDYLFNVVNPDDTIKQVAAGALSEVIGKMKLDEVLTTGREYLSSNVLNQIKRILTTYKAGLEVVAVTLRKVQAPDQVKAAFNDVNRADQEKATFVQQAQAYASKVVPLAEGQAARILADANGYKQHVSLNAQAQVAKYQALLSVYQTAPALTRQRTYLETLQHVFENTSKVLVDVNGSNNMLYLPLDKLMQRNNNDIDELETDDTTANSTQKDAESK